MYKITKKEGDLEYNEWASKLLWGLRVLRSLVPHNKHRMDTFQVHTTSLLIGKLIHAA